LVANLAGAERKGLAYGWDNAAVGITALPSSVIFGALYEASGASWRSVGERPLPWRLRFS
jgi:hypothetical protein